MTSSVPAPFHVRCHFLFRCCLKRRRPVLHFRQAPSHRRNEARKGCIIRRRLVTAPIKLPDEQSGCRMGHKDAIERGEEILSERPRKRVGHRDGADGTNDQFRKAATRVEEGGNAVDKPWEAKIVERPLEFQALERRQEWKWEDGCQDIPSIRRLIRSSVWAPEGQGGGVEGELRESQQFLSTRTSVGERQALYDGCLRQGDIRELARFWLCNRSVGKVNVRGRPEKTEEYWSWDVRGRPHVKFAQRLPHKKAGNSVQKLGVEAVIPVDGESIQGKIDRADPGLRVREDKRMCWLVWRKTEPARQQALSANILDVQDDGIPFLGK
ncbi:hypothetical protein DFH06DRAFT_1133558 [Mycena polygramma]|nr:hypothetical protein DFH06DRAFT_1133558 [Mycena polygramma]